MKKIPVFLICLLSFLQIHAQDSTISWQKSFGGSQPDYPRAICPSWEKGYAIAGFTTSNDRDVKINKGKYDAVLMSMDTAGKLKWFKTYGGSADDDLECISPTPDSGYIMGGWTSSSDGDLFSIPTDTFYMWILKVRKDGSIDWQRRYPGDEIVSIASTPDSGFIVLATTMPFGNNKFTHIQVLKLRRDGSLQWKKQFGGAGQKSDDVPSKILNTPDSGYVFNAATNSTDGDITKNHGNFDAWVVKLKKDGSIQWQKTYGGSSTDNLDMMSKFVGLGKKH